jgi:hypothetical protein
MLSYLKVTYVFNNINVSRYLLQLRIICHRSVFKFGIHGITQAHKHLTKENSLEKQTFFQRPVSTFKDAVHLSPNDDYYLVTDSEGNIGNTLTCVFPCIDTHFAKNDFIV